MFVCISLCYTLSMAISKWHKRTAHSLRCLEIATTTATATTKQDRIAWSRERGEGMRRSCGGGERRKKQFELKNKEKISSYKQESETGLANAQHLVLCALVIQRNRCNLNGWMAAHTGCSGGREEEGKENELERENCAPRRIAPIK